VYPLLRIFFVQKSMEIPVNSLGFTNARSEEENAVTPIFRSCRSTRTFSGHSVIGLIQHAARQPDASPEMRALAQRLLERQRSGQDCPQFAPRHPATTIGE